ncbi:hypothetical protein GQX74_010417 [Glossina fuscipes]|nr:hypothetical protein GQX74_010417 [Glossina fuscipes]
MIGKKENAGNNTTEKKIDRKQQDDREHTGDKSDANGGRKDRLIDPREKTRAKTSAPSSKARGFNIEDAENERRSARSIARGKLHILTTTSPMRDCCLVNANRHRHIVATERRE